MPFNNNSNTILGSFESSLKKKKKEVFPEKPAEDPANLKFSKVGSKPSIKKPSEIPEYIRNEAGEVKGLKLPDGRTFLGISKKEIDFLANKYLSKRALIPGTKYADVETPEPLTHEEQVIADELQRRKDEVLLESLKTKTPTPKISPEELAKLSQLTPEQQLLAGSTMEPTDVNELDLIAEEAIKQGTIGAGVGLASGTTGGFALAPFTSGLSIPAVAGIATGLGALAGAIKGTVNAVAKSRELEATMTVNDIDDNFQKAKSLIDMSIVQLNKGGNDAIAIEGYRTGLAEIQRIENSYRAEEARDRYGWVTKIKNKQEDLMFYRQNILPLKRVAFERAYQKPDPAYLG